MQESKSSRLFLISSIVLGVLAAVVSFAYLDQATGADRGPKVKILVAKHDLRENVMLDPEKDLEEMDIPSRMTALLSRGLRPDEKAGYKGQRVNRRILAGTPVMFADLSAVADLELKGDCRALSIPVRGAQALSGLLIPGDNVKVLVTRPLPRAEGSGQGGQWETVEVSPKAFKVLAVGSRLSRSRQQILAADQYHQGLGEAESQQTVTLQVTEEEARAILQQTGAGQLPVTLILCPPQLQNPSQPPLPPQPSLPPQTRPQTQPQTQNNH